MDIALVEPPPPTIAGYLPRLASQKPYTPAIIVPAGTDRRGRTRYVHYTWKELHEESDILAAGLLDAGIGPGVRTALLVRPGLDLFALAFALFKVGAVIVAVDPGMGARNMARCLDEAEPAAFLGIPAAHWARRLLGWGRRSVRTNVVVGPRGWTCWGMHTLEDIRARGIRIKPPCHVVKPEAVASIAFTSGSTGCPKGVVYTHAMFVAQVGALRHALGIEPGEIDLATFLHFAFFAPALGVTTVLADMDFSRPARADPRKIAEAINHFGVTNLFASPALLDRLGRWGEQHSARLPSLRRVVSAGAPVSAGVIERVVRLLRPGVEVSTPYGATEALPVSSIGCGEILGETRSRTDRGRGVCVGRVVGEVQIRIIRIRDGAIETWSDDLLVRAGEIGEIVVRGPVVSPAYLNRPVDTGLAQIADGSAIWHRMGDLGYLDEKGRLWFCGRKSQRVRTAEGDLFTISCEGVFNIHPHVFRTALVGVPRGGTIRPVLCVELEPGMTRADEPRIRAELLALGAAHEHTRGIRDILFHPGFPVDVRHNAKIRREELAEWARRRLR